MSTENEEQLIADIPWVLGSLIFILLISLALLPVFFSSPQEFCFAWSAHIISLIFILVWLFCDFLKINVTPLLKIAGRGVFVFSSGLLIVICFTPITYRDSLIHHIFIPELWISGYDFKPLKWHSWSHYPMAINLLYIPFLKKGYYFGPALCSAMYLIATSLFSIKILKKLLGNFKERGTVIFFVPLLILLAPTAFRLGTVPTPDIAQSFYCALSVYFALEFLRVRPSFKSTPSWICAMFLGLSLGAVMSIKYNGVLFIAILLCSLVVALLRTSDNEKKEFKKVLLNFTFVVFLIGVFFAPWGFRNIKAKGNPIYPLMHSKFVAIFGLKPDDKPKDRSISVIDHRRYIYGESWYEIFAVPVRVFLEGRDNSARYFDGLLHPIMIFALLPLGWKRGGMYYKFVYSANVLYFLLTLLLARARVRYQAPVYSTLGVLSLFGYLRVCLVNQLARYKKVVNIVVFSLIVTPFLFYVPRLMKNRQVIPFFTGKISKTEYLKKVVPEYNSIAYVNELLTKKDKVYAIYTGNFYSLFTVPVISGGHYSQSLFVSWLKQSDSVRAFKLKLKKNGLTHLFINRVRFNYNFPSELDEKSLKIWQEFSNNYLTSKFRNHRYSLLKIVW